MFEKRRILARFVDATPVLDDHRVGALLSFEPERSRIIVDRIEDFAELGPALTVPAVAGLGKVLRILRAARIALPNDPLQLVGKVSDCIALLQRAVGTRLQIEVRPRTCLRFRVWTEQGSRRIDNVQEVIEDKYGFLVRLRNGAPSIHVPRQDV
ncbi:MAG: hypothetical protein IH884_10890, partial [Myxococcales bacterium]|nr:hypothetical protein [Myxococcales bacterium]